MEENDENKEQRNSNNINLPYIMLYILTALVVLLIFSALNTYSSLISDYKKAETKTPHRAFDKSDVHKINHVKASCVSDDKHNPNNKNVINLEINPLESFNGKTKKEIYEIRKEYVKKSLFYTQSYKPNEDIFGQIVDGKDWWGLEPLVCSRANEVTTTGVSAVSRFINNPDLLIQTYFPFNLTYDERFFEYCNGRFSRNIPLEMTYENSKKTITAKYEMSPFVYKNTVNYYGMKDIKYPLILSGLNARDFGYDYMYINSYHNIKMLHENNASRQIHKIQDYIHVGGSCRMPGGCNNMSPRQPELEFNILALPAEMEIKLWKTKPLLPNFPGDIYFKIIFEKN